MQVSSTKYNWKEAVHTLSKCATKYGFEPSAISHLHSAKNVLIASAGAAAIDPAFMGLFKGVGYSVDQLSKVLSRKSAAEIDELYTESSKILN